MRLKKGNIVKISLGVPDFLVEEIDAICSADFITRTSWFIHAAKEKLERDKRERSKKLIEKLKELE